MNVSALEHYRGVPIGTRFFLTLRWHLTPYLKMAEKLPDHGRVLDLGCGHGLLSMALALQESHRHVLGIDHDPARVQAARKAARAIANLRFECGNVLETQVGSFSGITLIDVMHYFEPGLQETIFENAYRALENGGTLLVREVDHEGKGLASSFNRFYEKIATQSGFTRAEKPGLHFRTPDEWVAVLTSKGFEVTWEKCSNPLFADILYVCRKLHPNR